MWRGIGARCHGRNRFEGMCRSSQTKRLQTRVGGGREKIRASSSVQFYFELYGRQLSGSEDSPDSASSATEGRQTGVAEQVMSLGSISQKESDSDSSIILKNCTGPDSSVVLKLCTGSDSSVVFWQCVLAFWDASHRRRLMRVCLGRQCD